jgi:hypothetical protein
MASARRLRKSESATRPTVWFWRRSSAVFVWLVNLGFGVDAPDEGLEDMILRSRVCVGVRAVCQREVEGDLYEFVKLVGTSLQGCEMAG